MASNLRLCLVFKNFEADLGKRCWFLLDSSSGRRISDFQRLIQERFHIDSDIRCLMKNCVLPPEEGIELIRDEDEITVERVDTREKVSGTPVVGKVEQYDRVTDEIISPSRPSKVLRYSLVTEKDCRNATNKIISSSEPDQSAYDEGEISQLVGESSQLVGERHKKRNKKHKKSKHDDKTDKSEINSVNRKRKHKDSSQELGLTSKKKKTVLSSPLLAENYSSDMTAKKHKKHKSKKSKWDVKGKEEEKTKEDIKKNLSFEINPKKKKKKEKRNSEKNIVSDAPEKKEESKQHNEEVKNEENTQSNLSSEVNQVVKKKKKVKKNKERNMSGFEIEEKKEVPKASNNPKNKAKSSVKALTSSVMDCREKKQTEQKSVKFEKKVNYPEGPKFVLPKTTHVRKEESQSFLKNSAPKDSEIKSRNGGEKSFQIVSREVTCARVLKSGKSSDSHIYFADDDEEDYKDENYDDKSNEFCQDKSGSYVADSPKDLPHRLKMMAQNDTYTNVSKLYHNNSKIPNTNTKVNKSADLKRFEENKFVNINISVKKQLENNNTCEENKSTCVKNQSEIVCEENKIVHQSTPSIQVKKNFADLPPLQGTPRIGDKIGYKILELSFDYTPEISDYKEAEVLSFDNEANVAKLYLAEDCIKPKKEEDESFFRKFELPLSDDEGEEAEESDPRLVEVEWKDVITPVLI